MKRFYSHYSYIYPGIYLKNHIVEMDDNGKIINVFPFIKEVEKTEFYSGTLVFLPDGVPFSREMFTEAREKSLSSHGEFRRKEVSYLIYKED